VSYVKVLETDVLADVTPLAGGMALAERSRTVSTLRCEVCGEATVADGIVAHLVFEHDHQHGGLS
jgi:hypothetical protein